ncbi:MAG: polysaccharide deacetylase family protein [Chloroflexota bacterium]
MTPTLPEDILLRQMMNDTKCLVHRLFLILFIGIVGCSQQMAPETVAQIPTTTFTAVSPLATFTRVPTLTPTSTYTATPTATHTSIPPTNTPQPTHTSTLQYTNTPTLTAQPTITPTSTLPPTLTPTPLPLPTPQGTISWTVKVPILMYHYVSIPPEDADVYRTDLSVKPDAFLEQMTYLAENGYNPIDFYDLSRAITNQQELPEKPVILTFDDGYLDNYENAYPILEQFGFKGTFFIVTEFVDFGREEYMSWEMITEMAANGHRFEPHSRTHPDLRNRERPFLIWEMLGPQETLAFHLGYTPRYFSYPSGRYDQAAIDILDELDFWGAVTTQSGKWHGFPKRFEWNRLRVRFNTPLAEFKDMIDPGDTINGKRPEDIGK